MIDLSHLTEEEQGAIMAVLRRDAELKRAEEERIRRLEMVVTSDSQSGLKYLSGQWFYDAKSRRHTDKIHGSEIILASMKQRAAGSDVTERKTTGSRSSDLVAPPKPTRCLETTQPKEMNDAEKDSQNSAVHSPRTPRHNPFNSDALSVAEHTDNSKVFSPAPDRTPSETGTEELKRLPVDSSQTSGGSITVESPSLGFRPVPKKRSFLSKRTCSQSESSDPGMEPPLGSDGIVPAPRRSLQRGSSRCSNQSNPRGQSVAAESNRVSRSAHPSRPTDEIPQQPPCDVTNVLTDSILEVDNLPVLTSSRSAPTDRQSSKRSNDPRTEGEHTPGNTVSSLTGSFQDFHTSSSVTDAMKQEELSLTQSNVDADPLVSYELYYIDTADGQIQNKSTQMHSFRLSTQASSPTGEEEDSIAKVLDWFNRSTDSSDWLKAKDRHGELNTLGGGDSFRKDDTRIETPGMNIRETNVVRTTDKELSDIHDGEGHDARERLRTLKDEEKKQNTNLFQMKSFWEKSNTYPKISVGQNQGRKAANLSPHTVGEGPDLTSDVNTRKEIYDAYISNAGDESDDMLLIISQKKDGECVDVTENQESNRSQEQTPADTQILLLAKENPSTSSVQPKSQSESTAPLSALTPVSQLDLQTKSSPDSEQTLKDGDLHRNDIGISPKVQKQSGSSEDLRTCHAEDKSMQVSVSQKRKDDKSSNARALSPRSPRRAVANEENTAEKIKQLRSFWEQERSKPLLPSSRPKAVHGTNLSKLNKRFTRSEYDLRSIGGSPACGEEDTTRNHQNIPLHQRLDKMSPSLSASRSQFNTLRDFWDEATSECKGSLSSEKLKSPKKKEQMSPQHPREEAKCADPEPQPPQSASGCLVVNDGDNGKSLCVGQRRESKMSLKDQGKSLKPQSGKESRSPKRRKDFYNSSGGGSSFRRATSMLCLNVPAEKEHGLFRINVSPIHSQSRKQNMDETGQRTSEDVGKMSPRARAYVPRDYRHYLGVTDKTIVHPSLGLAQKMEAAESHGGHERELRGPLRASTPVGSEEGDSDKVSRLSPPPFWTNHSTSDTSHKSSVSSTSETWSNIWPSSQRDDAENQNPVRKALRRAEARPKNLAKSMVDIAAASSPRQEPPADLRSADVLSIPSSFTPTFSDPDHLKKMSKSVPSFLQKENDNKDSDCTDEDDEGSVTTNRSNSSGMASLSGSVMTVYGGDFGNVEVQGNIHFSINYVQKLKEFHIFIAKCQDLAAVDSKRGRSDPYVKSYLSPDKANLGKRKTTVKKKTLNPAFNEILRYRVRLEYLQTQTLILSVWHNDTFGRNSFLGEVDVDLSKWDFNHTQMNYLALKAKTTPTPDPSNGRGEMRLAVRYLPDVIHSRGIAKDGLTTGEIHIWVKECKNLPLIRTTIDPFVKCYVLPDTSRKSRQKTRVLRRTVDPVFNHTMVYDGFRESDLTEACVELTVWDRDRLASNLLGGLRLGAGTGRSYGAAVNWMDSTPQEVALWERMAASPNEWVEDVLPVRSLNAGKTAFK